MRLFAYIAAVLVLFALAEPSLAQVSYSVTGERHAAPASAKAAGLRLLSWPGKVMPASDPTPGPARDPSRPWAYLRARPTPAPEPPPAPASIYAPPAPPAPMSAAAPLRPPAPQVRALAQAGPTSVGPPASVRYYSLHRPYGDAPDPIPLSAQFLGEASPDLAAPPPPVPRTQTTASGQVIRAMPAEPDVPGPASNSTP